MSFYRKVRLQLEAILSPAPRLHTALSPAAAHIQQLLRCGALLLNRYLRT